MRAKPVTLLLAMLLLGSSSRAGVELRDGTVQAAMRTGIGAERIAPVTVRFDNWGEEKFSGAETRPTAGGKSVFRAVLYSAMVPGGGQYYVGKRKTARYFFAAEALTWLSYLSFRTYGNWRRDDYIAFAASHANANLEGKSDEFLTWVGFYDDIRQFNSFGRAWDPEREYLPDTPENHWAWKTDDDRQTYRDLRNRSLEAYRRSDFMIGLAIIDRVVSIIDAVRSVRKVNRQIAMNNRELDSDHRYRLSLNPFSTTRQVCFTVYPGF